MDNIFILIFLLDPVRLSGRGCSTFPSPGTRDGIKFRLPVLIEAQQLATPYLSYLSYLSYLNFTYTDGYPVPLGGGVSAVVDA
ncbi:hypothetical protein BDP55DRAFT_272475 [Colletotrichum godetiae]|uniref:Uncharacterized protein n=1 Tax=Colletotrichum godetiae TaxID=1209918 RepID=A0AAJ0AE06_9PEZI|nr:uncharacterized protein BDP55DRAFT_272475 [Colletotrichum godetiae]KAK1672146.1 hypothetical protein BDP55DRAFT_272475 [Colletotrichum godetiae]